MVQSRFGLATHYGRERFARAWLPSKNASLSTADASGRRDKVSETQAHGETDTKQEEKRAREADMQCKRET